MRRIRHREMGTSQRRKRFCEFRDRKTRKRDFESTARIAGLAVRRGLYYIHDNISWFARFQPPLTIERPLFEQGLDIFEECVAEVDRDRAQARRDSK